MSNYPYYRPETVAEAEDKLLATLGAQSKKLISALEELGERHLTTPCGGVLAFAEAANADYYAKFTHPDHYADADRTSGFAVKHANDLLAGTEEIGGAVHNQAKALVSTALNYLCYTLGYMPKVDYSLEGGEDLPDEPPEKEIQRRNESASSCEKRIEELTLRSAALSPDLKALDDGGELYNRLVDAGWHASTACRAMFIDDDLDAFDRHTKLATNSVKALVRGSKGLDKEVFASVVAFGIAANLCTANYLGYIEELDVDGWGP